MTKLTRALVQRHAGRPDAYGAALLDIAQDHVLWTIADAGLFDDDQLTFKGGTSLRKCRLGSVGRFSTDLDFTAPNDDVVLDVCEVIDGTSIAGFHFTLEPSRGGGRHWRLGIVHDELGTPDLQASVEFATRPLLCTPDRAGFVPSPIHKAYEIDLPTVPIITEAEACAEKLARYRRVALARDLYDLAQFAQRNLDETLVRRLWILKGWADVVDDSRGNKPLHPNDILRQRKPSEFEAESIGVLTRPIDIPAWEQSVRTRFAFLAQLDPDEQTWANCDPRDRRSIESASGVQRSQPVRPA